MKIFLLLPLAAVALLTGCASTGHCGGDSDYQRAYSLQTPNAPELNSAISASALIIPPERGTITPYAQRIPDAGNPKDSHTLCLDDPPKLALLQPITTQTAPAPVAPVAVPAIPNSH